MARVNLEIGGNSWSVVCRDGEEPQMRALGAMIDQRWEAAQRAAGDSGSFRVMLMIALMLADELNDVKAHASGDAPALAGIADQLEKLALALEHTPPSN